MQLTHLLDAPSKRAHACTNTQHKQQQHKHTWHKHSTFFIIVVALGEVLHELCEQRRTSCGGHVLHRARSNESHKHTCAELSPAPPLLPLLPLLLLLLLLLQIPPHPLCPSLRPPYPPLPLLSFLLTFHADRSPHAASASSKEAGRQLSES